MRGRDNEENSKSSRVEPFRTQEDIIKMQNYFIEKENWLMFLIFEIGIGTGRRIGDLLNLKWNNFYYSNGSKRRRFSIKEEKTGKFASPYITEAVWKAIEIYRKNTGCVVSENNYENLISLQLGGNYIGKPITKDACLKNIKKAAQDCGIMYNVGNHSLRKTFGYMAFNMFPNDPYRMQIIQSIFGHSSQDVTMKYIGLTDDHAAKIYDGIGDVMLSIMEGKQISLVQKATNLIMADYDEITKIMSECILWGQKHPGSSVEEVLQYVENIKRVLREINVM